MHSIFSLRILLLLLIFCILNHVGLAAHSAPQTLKMTMPDGVVLVADLYLPEGTGPFPTILVRTPYGKSSIRAFAQAWAEAGLVAVVQDVRGKFASAGDSEPLLAERADSRASLDWLVGQPWCDGNIGMWGTSYLAYCALAPAAEGHPNLKTIFVNSGYLHAPGLGTIGGANHILLNIPWLWYSAARRNQSVEDVEFETLFRFAPQKDVFRAHGLASKLWDNPAGFRQFNQDLSAGNLNIPIFHMTGWLDFVKDASLKIYQEARKAGKAPQQLLIGPWFHDQAFSDFSEGGDVDFGAQSLLGIEKAIALSTEWFQTHLMEASSDIEPASPVRFFLMGENRWVQSSSWPPKGVTTKQWFLGSKKGANSLTGDGLLRTIPNQVAGRDRFIFDPDNPVPTLGGANFHFFLPLLGVRNQVEIEKRQDVLVYTSAPLQETLYITGPIQANLNVVTAGGDTDFTAKLVAVKPNGYARIVEEGIQRLSAWLGPHEKVVPGQPYAIEIDLGQTALAIPAGHRLRVEISSSNFPKYDRNPNTGVDPYVATEFRKVENQILFGPKHPSGIVLPVWRRESTPKPGQ